MKREGDQLVPRWLPAAAATATALIVAAASHSCSSTPPNNTGGDFSSPSGLAITSAVDRDLLLIANSGTGDLRAINLCNVPTDGGLTTTCESSSDLRFIPGPIRVFPASFVHVGSRPLRLAGMKLLGPASDGGFADAGAVQADGGTVLPDGGVVAAVGGAVLVAGADSALYVLDANTLIAGEKYRAGTMPPPVRLALPGAGGPSLDGGAVPGDVVAEEAAGPIVHAYAVTIPGVGSGPAQIVALTGTLDAAGAQVGITARCTLDLVPGRLAMVPGQSDKLYLADSTPGGVAGGKGDGVLELSTAALLALGNADPPPPCPFLRRIPATNTYVNPPQPRPLASIALNPLLVTDYYATVDGTLDGGAPLDGGPALCPDGGLPPGPGIQCDPFVTYPAGSVLLGVTQPTGAAPDPTDPRAGKEAGALIFLRMTDGTIAPRPPHGFFDTATTDGGTLPVMEPIKVTTQLGGTSSGQSLQSPALAREVSFLKSPPPEFCAPSHPNRPCGLLVVAQSQQFVGLTAVVTASDGATYFLDVDRRRFFNDLRNVSGFPGPAPFIVVQPALAPAPGPDVVTPGLTLTNGDIESTTFPVALRGQGLLTAGVTRSANWHVVFHAQVPGLERHGGTMSVASTDADGTPLTYQLDMPGVDFSKYTSITTGCGVPGRYCVGLGVCDAVAFDAFSQPQAAPVCTELQNEQAIQGQRELTILAINGSTLTIGPYRAAPGLCPAPETADPPAGPFKPPASCFPVGVTAEVRVAHGVGDRPWLVFENSEVRGRAKVGEQFNGYEPRFDYPFDPLFSPDDSDLPVFTAEDIGFSFTLTGGDPVPKASWFVALASNQSPVLVKDLLVQPGVAGPVVVYSSAKYPNLVFTGITGANSVLMIDPSLIGLIDGVTAYR